MKTKKITIEGFDMPNRVKINDKWHNMIVWHDGISWQVDYLHQDVKTKVISKFGCQQLFTYKTLAKALSACRNALIYRKYTKMKFQ